MPSKTFTSGRIRRADYDPATRQLDLHWDNKTVLAYRPVPEEVFRRLSSAPYPGQLLGRPHCRRVPQGHAHEVRPWGHRRRKPWGTCSGMGHDPCAPGHACQTP
jgi:hypothetical protein